MGKQGMATRFLFCVCAFFAVAASSGPVFAQAAEEGYGGGSFVVTPVQECFDKLEAREVYEIKKAYPNPYQECLNRLKTLEEKAAAGKKKEAPPPEKEAGKEEAKAESSPAAPVQDPCQAYSGSYEAYAVCHDRLVKIQRMRDAKSRRNNEKAEEKPAEKPAAP